MIIDLIFEFGWCRALLLRKLVCVMDSSERRSSTFIDLLGFLSLHVENKAVYVGFDFTRFLSLQSKVYNKRFLRDLLIKKIILVLVLFISYVSFLIWLWMTSERYAVGDSWIIIGHETGCLNPINRLISITDPHNFFFQTKKTKVCLLGCPCNVISLYYFHYNRRVQYFQSMFSLMRDKRWGAWVYLQEYSFIYFYGRN